MRTLPLLLVLGVLGGCTELERYEGAFVVPTGLTVTPDGGHGPFNEPIGYVVNLAGGEIRALATRQGRYVNERPNASFLRGNPLPTGRSRVIHSLAAWSPEPELLTVYAADQAFAALASAAATPASSTTSSKLFATAGLTDLLSVR